MLDLARIRADTPGCGSIAHFNNSGSSLPPRPVVDAVIDYLRTEERMGGYEAESERHDDLERLYSTTSTMLGCSTDEIAFTANASDSWWRAFSSIPLSAGDRVLTGHSEFQTGGFGLLQARERGVIVDVIPNNHHGEIDLDVLDSRMGDDVRAIVLTQISMSNGAVQPAAAVGKRARSVGAVYLLDACQAAGQMPLDVDDLMCDFLLFTGRKFMRGPRGTGVLYARSSVIEHLGQTPFIDGRSADWASADTYAYRDQARRFEFGEQNFAGKVGLGVAIEYALDIGLEAIANRVQGLAARLRDELEALPAVTVRDEGTIQSGIVTFTVDGHPPLEVRSTLGRLGINVSSPGRENAQWDLGARGLEMVVRAGVHYFNTDEEIDRLTTAVASL